MSEVKKVVGLDDVVRALSIREGGGSWSQVIEATGFNGATLRPHITKFLQSKERLGRAATEKGDRVDSPYAVIQSVELTAESILSARKRGMAWYSISLALGVSEAKVRALAPESPSRVYVRSAKNEEAAAEAAAKEAAAKEKRSESARKAAATRAAKKAAKEAAEANVEAAA